MLECLILGDSIAVGIAQHKKECVSITRVGITSHKWYSEFIENPTYNKKYRVVVISLSTNDFKNMSPHSTEEFLYNIRKRANAQLVIWILPNPILKPNQHKVIKELAKEFGDKTLETLNHVGYDSIHPTVEGYKELAKNIK
jgi:lysophospholipase L1-like esterase